MRTQRGTAGQTRSLCSRSQRSGESGIEKESALHVWPKLRSRADARVLDTESTVAVELLA